jgi:nucleoside-diphosphate-sugar epimerase
MRSLVTGVTGFLGEALVLDLAAAHGADSVTGMAREPLPEGERAAAERLEAAGVRLVPLDLLALPACRRPVPEFDVLYHLAAETDSSAPAARLAVNDRGTAHLLETIGREALSGKRVVLAGATAAVDRGRRPRALMREDDPPCPRTAYGRSKLQAERLLAVFAEEWDFRFVVPRFSPVYDPSLSTGFLRAFRDQAEKRSILRRVGWPGRITIVRLEDAVRVLRFLGESGAADGRAVNVTDGCVYRYRDLLRDVRRRCGDGGWFLPVPRFVWGLARFFAWVPPFRRFVPWRLSCLLGDDLAADASRLAALLPAPLRAWEGPQGSSPSP